MVSNFYCDDTFYIEADNIKRFSDGTIIIMCPYNTPKSTKASIRQKSISSKYCFSDLFNEQNNKLFEVQNKPNNENKNYNFIKTNGFEPISIKICRIMKALELYNSTINTYLNGKILLSYMGRKIIELTDEDNMLLEKFKELYPNATPYHCILGSKCSKTIFCVLFVENINEKKQYENALSDAKERLLYSAIFDYNSKEFIEREGIEVIPCNGVLAVRY